MLSTRLNVLTLSVKCVRWSSLCNEYKNATHTGHFHIYLTVATFLMSLVQQQICKINSLLTSDQVYNCRHLSVFGPLLKQKDCLSVMYPNCCAVLSLIVPQTGHFVEINTLCFVYCDRKRNGISSMWTNQNVLMTHRWHKRMYGTSPCRC